MVNSHSVAYLWRGREEGEERERAERGGELGEEESRERRRAGRGGEQREEESKERRRAGRGWKEWVREDGG